MLLTMLAVTTGCSSWTVCTGGTVVPAVKNFHFSLYPSGITSAWEERKRGPGIGPFFTYYPAPKHPTKAFVEFDDEDGKHHFLASSIKLPWNFDGRILILVTRKEFLGKTGDIASLDRVKLKDYGHGIGCKARSVTMLEERKENYDGEYLLKVYLGDKQDFNDNVEKFIFSLQREDEHCISNIIFLVRDIPEEYEITRGGFGDPYPMPITSESGKRPEKQRSVYQGAKGELLWRRNYISISPLHRVEIGISSNGEKIMDFDAYDFGLPYNFRGDIAVFLVRDGDSYQLRIFVDKPGTLVAYKDYHSLCKALDKRYDSFKRKDVRFDHQYPQWFKDQHPDVYYEKLKKQGMCYLIDSR